jgi:hypothetical protein
LEADRDRLQVVDGPAVSALRTAQRRPQPLPRLLARSDPQQGEPGDRSVREEGASLHVILPAGVGSAEVIGEGPFHTSAIEGKASQLSAFVA